MHIDLVEYAILDIASDDTIGLWEAYWIGNSMFPGLDKTTVAERSSEVLLRLLEKGWIALATNSLAPTDVRNISDLKLWITTRGFDLCGPEVPSGTPSIDITPTGGRPSGWNSPVPNPVQPSDRPQSYRDLARGCEPREVRSAFLQAA